MSQPIDLDGYDPMERSVQQDPHPYYALLRREAPVYRHPKTGTYFVSRMDTIHQVLAEPRLFSSEGANRRTEGRGPVVEQLRAILAEGYPVVPTMLTADPPAQTRYRKSIGKPFGPRRVKELEPRIREITCALIEAWPRQGVVDFMSDFATPLPLRAISLALGMAPELEADVKRWSDDSVAAIGAEISDERRLEAARGMVESQKYWAGRFARCRREPSDDIVSNLVNADFEDADGTLRKLTDPELISMMRQFMVAGNETTTKLLNDTLRLLIEHPEQWRRIQRDPARIPAMVEEALRVASPNQGLFRTVTEDTELEGVKLPKGSRLWVIFGSANRDEKVFPDPDRFDPDRDNLKEHLAFGRGTHLCPGAPLARLEMRVAFEELTKRIDRFAFAPGYEAEYEPSYVLRGLTRMDVVPSWREPVAPQ